MSTAQNHGTHEQHRLVERWVASLAQLPSVEVIWLEGSLVDDRANPWSDVDLRIAPADDAYTQLWETDRAPLLEALGEYLLLWNKGFVRAVTAEGIIVELAARKVSELTSQRTSKAPTRKRVSPRSIWQPSPPHRSGRSRRWESTWML